MITFSKVKEAVTVKSNMRSKDLTKIVAFSPGS